MFNLWSKNEVKEIIDNMPKFAWKVGPSFYIDEKEYTVGELVDYIKNLIKENKDLNDVLKSIEEDGTVEHNNAIKLRQENVELKGELETLELEFNLVLEINNDINKKLIGLNHLKTENVELIERIKKLEEDIPKYKNGNSDWCKLYESASKDRTDLENKLDFEQKKYQILDHNYQGCTRYRDEYKHQLNAANKEIEALRSKLRDYQDKYAESFSYNDMNKLQKEIDDLTLMYKERDTKLKTYNSTLLGQIAGLKEENEKLNLQVTALHKIIEGSKSTIDEQKAEIKKLEGDIVDYVVEKSDEVSNLEKELNHMKAVAEGAISLCDLSEKTEEQKHPMYPIHWGGYDKNIKEFVESELNNEDPVEGISELLQKAKDLTEGVEVDLDKSLDDQCDQDILKQAKEQSIEEIVDALKGIKTQGFEDYDLRDFVESEIKNEDPLEGKQVKYTWCYKCQYITEQCKCNEKVEKWCTTKVAIQDAVQAKQREVYGVEEPAHFTKELESDKEDLQKSLNKPGVDTWEEVASDLALKVAKLEQKIEEFTSDPNYKYFSEHGKWPYSAMNPDGTLKTINC